MEKYSLNRYALSFLLLLLPGLLFASPPSSSYTYTTGEKIQPSEVQQNETNIYNYLSTGVDTYADGSIVNADISGSAAIVDTKLAQIATAGKVSTTAITGTADWQIKGWINFNGTDTIAIRDSYNVSSIVDNGTGIWTINWDTDFADATYALTVSQDNYMALVSAISAGYAQIASYNNNFALQDASIIMVMAIGDQ